MEKAYTKMNKLELYQTVLDLAEENKNLRERLEKYTIAATCWDSSPSLNCSQNIADILIPELAGIMQEHFYAIILDNKHKVLKKQLVTIGTLNQSLVHPRECFAPALEIRAAAVAFAHNHPSGDSTPSTQDIEITKRLKEVGELLGIKVLDHLIIGGDNYYSFVDNDIVF